MNRGSNVRSLAFAREIRWLNDRSYINLPGRLIATSFAASAPTTPSHRILRQLKIFAIVFFTQIEISVGVRAAEEKPLVVISREVGDPLLIMRHWSSTREAGSIACADHLRVEFVGSRGRGHALSALHLAQDLRREHPK